jgi:DNA-binding MarR family transcriptional regulator
MKEAVVQEFIEAQNEVHALLLRALEPAMEREGLTMAQVMTLKNVKALTSNGHSCKMSDLAAQRSLTPAAATGIVDRLIQPGLVSRSMGEHDRRVILLSLTEEGEAALAKAEKVLQDLLRGFFERISDSEQAASLRVFRKLREYLNEELAAARKK